MVATTKPLETDDDDGVLREYRNSNYYRKTIKITHDYTIFPLSLPCTGWPKSRRWCRRLRQIFTPVSICTRTIRLGVTRRRWQWCLPCCIAVMLYYLYRKRDIHTHTPHSMHAAAHTRFFYYFLSGWLLAAKCPIKRTAGPGEERGKYTAEATHEYILYYRGKHKHTWYRPTYLPTHTYGMYYNERARTGIFNAMQSLFLLFSTAIPDHRRRCRRVYSARPWSFWFSIL